MLRGTNPSPVLRLGDEVEIEVLTRALNRAQELRRQELSELARLIRNEICDSIKGG